MSTKQISVYRDSILRERLKTTEYGNVVILNEHNRYYIYTKGREYGDKLYRRELITGNIKTRKLVMELVEGINRIVDTLFKESKYGYCIFRYNELFHPNLFDELVEYINKTRGKH